MRKEIFLSGVAVLALIVIGSWCGQVIAENSLQAPEDELIIDGRKPATFSHPVHLELGLECGVCHHDQEHNPLSADTISALESPSQIRCVSCHNSNYPDEKLRKAKDVFHARCKTCHSEGYAGKSGPTKCTGCHIKKKKALEGC